MKLTDWINNKLAERQWSMRELARRGNITSSTISDILSEKRTPTYEACIAFWLGLLSLVGLIAAIDWKKLWRKRKWQMIVGVELTLIIFIYTSGLFALVPGASAADTEAQNWIHLKPLTIEVTSARAAQDVTALAILKAQPKGEFLVIQTKITNSSAEPARIWGSFELYDIRGRRFDAHVSSWFAAIDAMNPGLASEPTLAFDVPSASGLWLLTLYPNPLQRIGGVTVAFLVP